jgi:chromosome segregation ATPase
LIYYSGDSTPRKSGANRDELGETLLSLKTQYEQLQEQVRADREISTNQQQEITRLQHTLRLAEHAASTALKQAESEHERKLASLRREKQTLETDHNVLQNASRIKRLRLTSCADVRVILQKLERTETNLRETQAQVRKVQQQLREVRNQLTQSEKTGDVVQAENVDLKEVRAIALLRLRLSLMIDPS